MRRILSIITTLLLIAAAGSCRGNDEFSRFAEINPSGWAYNDTVRLLVTNLDSLPMQQLSVGVVHSDDFPYRNLWVEVSFRDSTGKQYRDSVSIEIADQYGRWLGNSIGGSHQCQATLPHAFPLTDSTEVAMRHIMRIDTVRGIDRIGLTVSRWQ